MKKTLLFLALFLFAAFFLSAESRNALLVANASYANAPLATPIQEARGLKRSLEKLGFVVTLVENAGISEMESAVAEFGGLLKRSGGIGFFHYGGHAVQIGGRNYLIPAKGEIASESQIKRLSLDLDELMENMQGDTNIVILDSCRDNPFPSASRGVSRGLALSYVKPKNSIIVYSAEAGEKAQDGVFTPILTEKLLEKKSLHSILLDVRREVNKATGGRQLPKNDDGLLDDVYLAGYPAALGREPVSPHEAASVPSAASIAPSSSGASNAAPPKKTENSEYAMWAAVDTGNDLGAKVNKVMTLAEFKSGARAYRIRTFGGAQVDGAQILFCVDDLHPAYGGLDGRVLGISKKKNGFCIARTKSAKGKSLPASSLAAAEKIGWRAAKPAGAAKELELQFSDESAFKIYLDNYEKASDELAEILKAFK